MTANPHCSCQLGEADNLKGDTDTGDTRLEEHEHHVVREQGQNRFREVSDRVRRMPSLGQLVRMGCGGLGFLVGTLPNHVPWNTSTPPTAKCLVIPDMEKLQGEDTFIDSNTTPNPNAGVRPAAEPGVKQTLSLLPAGPKASPPGRKEPHRPTSSGSGGRSHHRGLFPNVLPNAEKQQINFYCPPRGARYSR